MPAHSPSWDAAARLGAVAFILRIGSIDSVAACPRPPLIRRARADVRHRMAGVAGHCRSPRCAGAGSGRALENPQTQVFLFRWTALVALDDSALHAVDEGGTQFGLLQYVGHVRPE